MAMVVCINYLEIEETPEQFASLLDGILMQKKASLTLFTNL